MRTISGERGTNYKIIEGVQRRRLNVFADARGELGVLEHGTDLDFNIQRVFFIKAANVDAVRAGHACSAAESIVAISGSVTVDVDNGRENASELLTAGAYSLYIKGGLWRRLRSFAPDTILMVAASQAYTEVIYSDAPFE
jgi:WxcM-like, C-terminal